ncbi:MULTISPECIES: NaeI family type II restriction endonuclease [unclassified Crossiella]|uniref:NaeI family type II restriction endonuclease n=1 Tax=unclassified Crossiella TaxID=2620835 RepID=UPI001FFFB110|nr:MULTISPECIES: NaeI family type II restriction endonuclease [unclassified Crossiella]MCK2236585.1 restriction endonuclease [Crossiella sp. S99.2]MCK2250252.1 restriction endonuclease [Crossiella sp. S99.1]
MMIPGSGDAELQRVVGALYEWDPDGNRTAAVLRDTLDQLYDGQHTGRWAYGQLHKTEKTHMGTLVEINLHREFKFDDGNVTDYSIDGIEVDCKFSMKFGGWMLPPESVGHLCLLMWADDSTSSWSAGLIRVERKLMTGSTNRDLKGRLSQEGRAQITPLWLGHGRLDENLLLHLPGEVRSRILDAKARRGNQHGQARVCELFRSVQRRIVRRAVLATVAQQDDFMKRARSNGGARDKLRPEGILVLGHQDNDPDVAQALSLPRPMKGELVSARVVPAREDDPRPAAEIEGRRWRLAESRDPVVPAPVVPRGSVRD